MGLTLFFVVDQVSVVRLLGAVLERQGIVHKAVSIHEVSVGVGLHMVHNVIIDRAPENHEA